MKKEMRAIKVTWSDGHTSTETYAYPGPNLDSPTTPEQMFRVIRGMAEFGKAAGYPQAIGYEEA